MRITIFMFLAVVFLGCGGSSSSNTHKQISLMGNGDGTVEKKEGVNPHSLAYESADKALDRNNKIKVSKIESKTKVEIEKIKSQNQLEIAKIDAETKKAIAQTDYKAQVKASEVRARMYKENMRYIVYIVGAIALVVIIGLILLFLNAKKNRELQKRLHEDKLRHEQFLKDKELEEQRVHKLLELIASGKVAKNVEKEVILSISSTKPSYIHDVNDTTDIKEG